MHSMHFSSACNPIATSTQQQVATEQLSPSRAIAFIDPTVSDYAHLVAGVTPGTDVVVLDSDRDAIEQISEILQQRAGIASLHIISHGSPGALHFSTTRLTNATLDQYANDLQSWSLALTQDADLLLYGCNVAADSEPGAIDFLHRLAELTGAHVAASNNLTGHAALGGDWNLEFATGQIQAGLAFEAATRETYPAVLADPTNTTTSTNTTTTTNTTTPVDFGAGSTSVSTSTVIQADGKIVVGGYVNLSGSTTSDFTLLRYNADRSLDTSFGTSGKIVADAGGDDKGNGVAIDASGRIFIAGATTSSGKTSFGLLCYKADGTLDTSFGTSGKVTIDFSSDYNYGYSVKVDGSGNVLIVGTATIAGKKDLAIVRYTANGTLDTSFGTGGKMTTDCGGDDDEGKSITIDAQGRVIVAGTATINGKKDFTVVRYTANGMLDTSFGTGGKVSTDCGGGDDDGKSITIDAQGRIIVAGTATINGKKDFAVVRYTANGTLDTSFGTGGKATVDLGGDADARTITIDASGKLLIGGAVTLNGSTDSAIVRLNVNGSLDTSFGTGGKQITDYGGNDAINGLAIDAKGQLVLAGATGGANGSSALVGYQKPTSSNPCGCDFNRDGNADIVWYDAKSGSGKVWIMDGFSVKETVSLPTLKGKGKWEISGLADFNGDGKTDALYHNLKNGKTQIVLLDGATPIGTINLPKLKDKWKVGGVADFDSDGKADVICHDSKSGKTEIWEMGDQGGTIKIKLPKFKGKWEIAGLADFDGDGKTDVLWQEKKSGKLQVWQLNGSTLSSTMEMPALQYGWSIKAMADFNSDGKTDLVCQDNRSGAAQLTMFQGQGYINIALPGSYSQQVQGAADYNGDGKTDILWSDRTTNGSGAWFLKDITKSMTQTSLSAASASWQQVSFTASISAQFQGKLGS